MFSAFLSYANCQWFLRENNSQACHQFRYLHLQGLVLSHCHDLRYCDFSYTDMAYLVAKPELGECGAQFDYSHFVHADLNYAYFEATLCHADFAYAQLRHAHFQLILFDESLPEGRRIQVFNHINFSHANLEQAIFSAQDYALPKNAFVAVNFSGANLLGLQWQIKGLSLNEMLKRVILCATILPNGQKSYRDCKLFHSI